MGRNTRGTKGTRSFGVIFLCLLCLLCSFSQTPEQEIGLRLIAVRTETEAADLLRQIQSGQSFESIAKAHSSDPSAKDGGYLGMFRLSDLKPDLQRIVMGLLPGQISAVTPIAGDFLILKRLTIEEANWIPSFNAGLEAFQNDRYEEAERNFIKALPYAEKLKPADDRLEDSLHGLAEAYRLQKKYAEADPVYRRYLALHWGGAAVPEVLDDFCTVLALSYFRDFQFTQARTKFQDAANHAPMAEGLYQAMSTILFKAELTAEAEAVMDSATRLFPTSRNVRYHLAELYLGGSKPKKALEVFEYLSRMKPEGADPAVDRLQQSVVYQKIGSIHAELAESDKAVTAYKKALEFTPDSVEARVGLGNVYLQQGRAQDSLDEYNRAVAAAPQSAAAYSGIADASLRMGLLAEASEAAAKVLEIDSGYRKAHYVRATALARMGANEESDREFDIFRKVEEEARLQTDRIRYLGVLNRDAAAKLLEGHPEEAVEMFLNIIQSFPDSATAYLNLGFAQSRLGQHKAAAETFQKILSQSISDSFLVSWSLAREYRYVGDKEASRRHEIVYLQNIDIALREALDVGPD